MYPNVVITVEGLLKRLTRNLKSSLKPNIVLAWRSRAKETYFRNEHNSNIIQDSLFRLYRYLRRKNWLMRQYESKGIWYLPQPTHVPTSWWLSTISWAIFNYSRLLNCFGMVDFTYILMVYVVDNGENNLWKYSKSNSKFFPLLFRTSEDAYLQIMFSTLFH